MKMVLARLAMIGCLLLLINGTATAAIANLGFEDGLTGWYFDFPVAEEPNDLPLGFEFPEGYSTGRYFVAAEYWVNTPNTETTFESGVYGASGSGQFLALIAGAPVLNENGDVLAEVYTTAYQFFDLISEETISGWAAFDYGDYGGWNDSAYIKIFDPDFIETEVWRRSGQDLADFENTPWEQWSYVAPNAGNYLIEFGVKNAWDDIPEYRSTAFFDDVEGVYSVVQPSEPIPEPSTLVLLGLGMAGVVGLAKRKK